jgi:hypothetical protein
MDFLDLFHYVPKYTTLCGQAGPHLQAYFFQNSFHYIMIVYTAIKPINIKLVSNTYSNNSLFSELLLEYVGLITL